MTNYEKWLECYFCLIDATVSIYWASFSQLYRYPRRPTSVRKKGNTIC